MRDLNDKNTGNSLSADEWNDMPSEIQEVIEQTGQTLSGADLKQLAKGIAQYAAAGDFYLDGGAADAYTLTPLASKQRPVAYTDGMRIRFRPDNTNTGASTVNVDSLGVTSIFYNAAAATAGVLPAGIQVECEYDSTNARFNLLSTENAGLTVSGAATLFTSSGAFVAPFTGDVIVELAAAGGGGGGGGGDGSLFGEGGNGGDAGQSRVFKQAVIGGNSYTVTIGAGGAGGAGGSAAGSNGVNGVTGGNSTFDATTINGGVGGIGGLGDTGNTSTPNRAENLSPFGSRGANGITTNPPTVGANATGQGAAGGGGGGSTGLGTAGAAGGAGVAGACVVFLA